MHELGIVREVVAIAAESARGARVLRVVLEVGRLTAVVPDALRFAFDVVAEGTPVQGAELEIREVPARARCRACGDVLELEEPWADCRCGGAELDWISGNELLVKELEVA